MGTTREQAFEQAKAKWPGVALDYGVWCAHLDALGWSGELPATSASLFLCCACAHQDPEACRRFEEVYSDALRGEAARENNDEEFVDWVMRSVRQHLFGAPTPRLASYDGRRPLSDWLRLVVRRRALEQKLADRAIAGTPSVPPADVRRIREAR
jgi:hypothetical protein